MNADLKKLARRFNWWWTFPDPLFTYDPGYYHTTARRIYKQIISGKTVEAPGKMFWHHGQERGAHAWELLRRIERRLKLKSYRDLTFDEQMLVNSSLGKSEITFVASSKPGPGYSEGIHWKLDEPNDTLKRGFEKFIEEQRRKQKIRARVFRQGRTTNKISWRWPMVLDLKEAKMESHPIYCRKARTSAETAGRKHLDTVLKLLPKAQQQGLFAGIVTH